MTRMEQVLELACERGIIQAREAEARGIHRQYIKRLEQQGRLIRSARGIYTFADAPITERHTFAEAAKRVPQGFICLLSALNFHELTTQTPFDVWVAIPQKARAPKENLLPLRMVRMSDQALEAGIEQYEIEGVCVPVYSPAKTVVDCFKFRSKVGLDVGLEALRECLRKKCCTVDEIWQYAKICRMQNVMRPYLEALK